MIGRYFPVKFVNKSSAKPLHKKEKLYRLPKLTTKDMLNSYGVKYLTVNPNSLYVTRWYEVSNIDRFSYVVHSSFSFKTVEPMPELNHYRKEAEYEAVG